MITDKAYGIVLINMDQSRGNDFKFLSNAYSIAVINRAGDLRKSDIEQFMGRGSRD